MTGQALVRDPGGLPGYPAICQVKGFFPGTGEETSDRCGEWQGHVALCSGSGTKHPVIKFQYSCHKLSCPTCYSGTLVRNAKSAAQRVDGYRKALAAEQSTLDGVRGSRPRSPRHIIFSPPAVVVNGIIEKVTRWLSKPENLNESLESEFIRRFRQSVYEAAEASGLDGAGVIIHLFRTTPRAKKLHNESGSDLRIWDWIRHREDLQDLIRFSPHAHLKAYGSMRPSKGFYEESGGWVYRNLGDVYNLEGLLVYLLGHTQLIRERVSITYWGCLHSKRLKCTKTEPVKEEVVCEECGAVMVHGRLHPETEALEELTDRPFRRRVVLRTYQVVRPPPVTS